jgi:hypothetical protein
MAWTYYQLPLAALVWLTSIVLYRIYLHPLSKIPGPKLAAATHLYITYFNTTGGSKFYLQTEKLHQKYGTLYSRISLACLLIEDRTRYQDIPG